MNYLKNFRKYKLPLIAGAVIALLLIAGLGDWFHYNYLHGTLFTASSDGSNNVYTSKTIKVPNNWGIGWQYDCSNVKPDNARFVIITSDSKGNPNTDGVVAEANKKSGEGVTVVPQGGAYRLQISSDGCTWQVSAKRSSRVAAYDHEIDYSIAQQAAQKPQMLLDLSGSGSQQTKAFTTSNKWNVAYTYDCSNLGSQGNFQFDINNTDNSSNTDTGANDLGMSGGTTDYYYDSGEHYLAINSECNWHITVQS